MSPKRILIFSTSYYPFVGGAEVAVKEITDRLMDIRFDLITAKQKNDLPAVEKRGNVNIYRLGLGFSLLDKLLLPFHGAIFALRLNKENHYDFFWCIMVRANDIFFFPCTFHEKLRTAINFHRQIQNMHTRNN